MATYVMAEPRPGEVVMRLRAGLPIVALVLILSTAAADVGATGDRTVGPQPAGASGEEAEEHEEGGGTADAGPTGSDQWFAAQRLYPFTAQPSLDAAYRAALDQATTAARAPRAAAAAAWQPLGPSNIGGRVTDLVVDPVRSSTVYAGAATGGVWRSTDGGVTFRSAWPATITPSIGALAITPAGTLYAGTGEGNPGGGSVTFPGNGVFRSTDGGATWASAGLAGSDRIGRLAVDPTNPNRLFAAAAGSLFTPGGVRGLFRTTDGGTTWNRVGGGLPASSTNLGRMGVAIARSNSARMYVIAADTTGNFLGFWT